MVSTSIDTPAARHYHQGDVFGAISEERERLAREGRLLDMLEQLQHTSSWLTLEVLRLRGDGHFLMPRLDTPEARKAANEAQGANRGGSIKELRGELNSVFGELTRSQAEQAQLREALGALLGICCDAAPQAFANGVTDQSGSSDEGEHFASLAIERARALLGPESAV